LKRKRWIYLLTGLMYPFKRVYPDVNPDSFEILSESIGDVDIKTIGIKLRRVFLNEEDSIRKVHVKYEYRNEDRFIFYIRDAEKDDCLAQCFADAVMLSLAVAYDIAIEETPKAIRIPESCLKKGRIIKIKDVVGSEGIGGQIYSDVVHAVGVPSDVLDYVWHIVPVILMNQSLMDATSFYRESITQAWVADDDVYDIMWDNSDLPSSKVESARVETAYQNAFKAVEAVIGEPPKDEKKLRLALIRNGVNPDEIVGYDLYDMKPGKETLVKKVIDMHQIRDKIAAHGKTNKPRTIGYCELKDKQALACHIILTNINSILKSRSEASNDAQNIMALF
jgi:hypothetical protein